MTRRFRSIPRNLKWDAFRSFLETKVHPSPTIQLSFDLRVFIIFRELLLNYSPVQFWDLFDNIDIQSFFVFFYVFNSATSCIWTSYWFSPFHRPKREDFYVMISTTKIYILYCFMESFFYLKLKKIIISQNVAKYLPCIRNLRHKGVSTPHQTSSPKYMSYMF